MRTKLPLFLCLALLLSGIYFLEQDILHYRLENNYRPPGLPLDRLAELPVEDLSIVTIGAIMGGFRSLAADILWMKTDQYWHSGRWFRMLPICKAVALLEPNFIEVWTITGWHLAYNMSVEANSPEEAAKFIRDGITFLREGIKWNPNRYDLYFELGWTFYDKLNNYERAAEYFKKALQFKHPAYMERLIAHAYERVPDIDQALKWYSISLRKYGLCDLRRLKELEEVGYDTSGLWVNEGPLCDRVSVGAITTIYQRYVRAWRLYKEGRYDEALLQLKRDWQKDDPYDTIAMHFLARIYEKKAATAETEEERGANFDLAVQTWLDMAEYNASDKLARRRVIDLLRLLGREDEIPPTMNDVGLPEIHGRPRETPTPRESESASHTHI
ncbi:MAG TPA: tetratricopeptide repeat protein [Armatimonadetes bacterium]|nr:tetratricopeptide repeat protein [Armatimonadota bacterium]